MKIEITKKIIEQWVESEAIMASYEGDNNSAYYAHQLIGEAIYGDNLAKVRDFIYNNCEGNISAEELQQFQVKLSNN